MTETSTVASPESLSGVPAGVDVEIIESLLPGGVAAAGDKVLRTGSRWRCRLNGNAIMLLHSRGGRLVSLRRDEARYIRVRRLGGEER